jgi:hypothetical protein
MPLPRLNKLGVRGEEESRWIQPERELRPSKSKQNQAKLLGFPWIYSSESGLFKGLRAKK